MRRTGTIKLFEVGVDHPLHRLNIKVNRIMAMLPAAPVTAAAAAAIPEEPIVQVKRFILEKFAMRLQELNPGLTITETNPKIFSKALTSETNPEFYSLYLGITSTSPRKTKTTSTTDKQPDICVDDSYEDLSTGATGNPRFKVKLSFLDKILDDCLYEKEISHYGVSWSRYKQQLIHYANTIPVADTRTDSASLRSAIVSGLYPRYQHFEEMGFGATWNGSFFKIPFHFAAENNIDRTLYLLANYNNPWKALGHSHTEEVSRLIELLSTQLNAKKAALIGKSPEEQRRILNEADQIIFRTISPLYNELSNRGESGSLMAKLQYLLLPYFIKHIETHDRELYTNLQAPRAERAGILPLRFMVYVDLSTPAASSATAAAAAAASVVADSFGGPDNRSRWAFP